MKFIFQAYLDDIPIKEILVLAREMGFKQTGNSAISKILNHHTYVGLFKIKAYKDLPDEMVEARHQPLIDRVTWYDTQQKLNKGKRGGQVIMNDNMPLRTTYYGRSLQGKVW